MCWYALPVPPSPLLHLSPHTHIHEYNHHYMKCFIFRPDKQLMVRTGIHTGPCAAGNCFSVIPLCFLLHQLFHFPYWIPAFSQRVFLGVKFPFWSASDFCVLCISGVFLLQVWSGFRCPDIAYLEKPWTRAPRWSPLVKVIYLSLEGLWLDHLSCRIHPTPKWFFSFLFYCILQLF